MPPPVVKDSERLLLAVETAVRKFTRYHKYSVGSDLRNDARTVARLAHRAWRDREHQREVLPMLVSAVDDFKITLQLSSQVRAFSNFAHFEALSRLARNVGKQAGGWNRQHTHQGQNAAKPISPQRAKTLSTRSASPDGANQ